MGRLKKFISSETVLVIAFLAAVISMIFVPPSSGYADYIDFPVIIMLFCLMGVVAAFRGAGVFSAVTAVLLKRTSSARVIGFIMMNLCFFSSMLVTNDVALITFVPLTVGIAANTKDKSFLIRTVVIETAAANLGSMMTPIGNPQNLFLYEHFNLTSWDFIGTMLPPGLFSYLILCLSILLIKKDRITYEKSEAAKPSPLKITVYSVLFAVCIVAVAGLISKYICLAVVAVGLLIFDRSAFRKIDYSLLATFVCFFVFVGNMGAIDSVSAFISSVMDGRELLVAALLSQIISNLPAAVMLSGFTSNAHALLAGVNIGGMGTPVASLASLISLRCYGAAENADKKKYMGFLLVYNFAFLALLLLFETFVLL